MLERFHVPTDKAVFVKPKEISKVIYQIFIKIINYIALTFGIVALMMSLK